MYKHLVTVTDRWQGPCCVGHVSFAVCEQIWALFKQTPLGRNWKWKAPWPTAASPYAGKWVSSRDSWLCQVWQKWPVFSLWLLLMLNYINYECGSQRAWGGRSISVSLLKAVPLIIHHWPCSTEPQHWATDPATRLTCMCVCSQECTLQVLRWPDLSSPESEVPWTGSLST